MHVSFRLFAYSEKKRRQTRFSSHFTIYDTDDSKRVMKECQKLLGVDDKFLSHKTILNEISRAKDSLISPDDYLKSAGNDVRLRKMGECYKSISNF